MKAIFIPKQYFKDDTRPIVDIPLEKYDKVIFIKWYNSSTHNIPEKIKTRTHFNSVSEFNDFMKKAFKSLIDNHFKEIDQTDRYALHFKENNFYRTRQRKHRSI